MQDDPVSSENLGRPPAASPHPTPPDETTGVRRRDVPLIAEPAVPPPPDYSRE